MIFEFSGYHGIVTFTVFYEHRYVKVDENDVDIYIHIVQKYPTSDAITEDKITHRPLNLTQLWHINPIH